MSAFGGKADIGTGEPQCPLLTQSGHRPSAGGRSGSNITDVRFASFGRIVASRQSKAERRAVAQSRGSAAIK
jgi:hypothetical protein